ncbi:MAG: hypothetical protein ACK5NT_05235 [Pyrinomonadaceae bacterium]
MIFHENVPEIDKERIISALSDIKKYGTGFHQQTAEFIEKTELVIYLGPATEVRGSGSVQLDNQRAARRSVEEGNLSVETAARYVRLNIARETIDTGGQQGIEGTLVHEGKHARDFALMLSTYSKQPDSVIFNPTAYQRELSAHLSAAQYLRIRGGSYAKEGESLGLLLFDGSDFHVNPKGIRARLRNNYRLTPETPGSNLNACSNPKIGEKRKKFLGIF